MGNAKPYRDCPPSMSTNDLIITETWHDVPLSRERYINPMGVWLKLRFGYFSLWPNQNTEPLLRQRTPDTSNVPNRKQVAGIGFAFWMPSQCWPERDRPSVTYCR